MPRTDPQYWDAIAPLYDELYNDDWSRLEDEVTRNMVQATVSAAGGRVLDIGCGTGFGYALCQELTARVEYTGVDISREMLRVARARFPEGRFLWGNGGVLALEEPASFDVVLMLNGVLSFVENAKTTLRHASTLLRRGGGILASGLARYSLRRLVHGRLAAHEEFATRGTTRLAPRTTARAFAVGELRRALRLGEFDEVRVRGVGVFAGVAQWPALWGLDQLLCRLIPDQAHMLWGTGLRR